MTRLLAAAPILLAAGLATGAQAQDPEPCRAVRFSDVGWTDIAATTATASVILEALGYEPETSLLSIPVTYAAMRDGAIDVYLGDWQPSMEVDRAPYLEDGSIEVVGTNLTGAKYTLAVPAYVAEAGVRDFADLAAHRDEFEGRIYGIEPGNNGNRIVLDMIATGEFGLGDWELVESSEQGMLAEVGRAVGDGEWIVFLGWAPHPMNASYPLAYLSGGDAYFGPDYGGAEVMTNVRAGYGEECPNVARFASNLRFTVEMENEVMGAILNDGAEPREAALDWLRTHPEALAPWLAGVTTFGGEDGLAAVAAMLEG